MTRPLVAIGRRLPHGWHDLLLQLGLFFFAYQGYQLVRGLIDGKTALAFDNADRIVALERGIGSFFEPGLQAALLESPWLIDIANWLYVNTHFVITTTFLAWLYLFRNRHFPFVRNMFMVAMTLALIGYALFPTAPPRMLPGEGFVDTIASFGGLEQDSHAVSLLVNKYAAVPSMHIGFALMIAGGRRGDRRQPGGPHALVHLPAPRLRRRPRDREPLLVRRRRRCGRGRRLGTRRAPAARARASRLVVQANARRGHRLTPVEVPLQGPVVGTGPR